MIVAGDFGEIKEIACAGTGRVILLITTATLGPVKWFCWPLVMDGLFTTH